MKKQILTIAFFLGAISFSWAQINMPPPSPTFTEQGTVGLAELSVTYSRPSMNGRKIFGDLIPFGDVWRTGANASTKISFSDDVTINGNELARGEYALYTIPGEREWTIIFNNNLRLWGSGGYSAEEDALRLTVKSENVAAITETFTISFSDFTPTTAKLNILWEGTKASFTIAHEVDSKVMAQIKAQVVDATPENASLYFQAASYYFNTDREIDQALGFVNKAIAGGTDAYWVIHLKAKIQAKLGDKKEAKESAQKSIELAKTAGNMDYVRLNEKLIAEL